ncbi:MAG: class I SAM-dependent methyltransferase [Actinobacteria bacterium]|nr:MAG: class I SAM-dependent methyltransferase [Actinomycetota bacterium]
MARPLLAARRLLARLALVEDERANRARELSALESKITAGPDSPVGRLADQVKRVSRENAAILRLLEDGSSSQVPTGPAPVSRKAVFSEVERGSRQDVMAKLRPYLGRFRGHEPIVDLGCGRGEFLELARSEGLAAYGVDNDPQVVARCRELGLEAREEDLIEHLSSLEEGLLGGAFSAQVVEHLPPETLPILMHRVARVLAPGGVVVIETPNPSTFATHVQSFWRDPTHTRPVPEDALGFAARTAGLVVEDVLYSSPLPDEERLQSLRSSVADHDVRALVEAFNTLVDRLNQVLFGYQDYALVARKPKAALSD